MEEFERAASLIESFAFQTENKPQSEHENNALQSNIDHIEECVEEYAIEQHVIEKTKEEEEITQKNGHPDLSEYEFKQVEPNQVNEPEDETQNCASEEIYDQEEKQDLSNIWFAVFDTETTGISAADVVVQLCVLVYDLSGILLHTYNEYWKMPDGVTMNPRAEATHNISKQILQSQGLDGCTELAETIHIFETFLENNIPVVAHNAAFDNRLLKQTAQRHQMNWPFEASQFFCTQKASRNHVKAKDKVGRIKAPSNLELYVFFKKCQPKGNLHDALVDCEVTAVGFIGGSKAGWW
jgi:DNA polymerase III epsilon subunit-like protein